MKISAFQGFWESLCDCVYFLIFVYACVCALCTRVCVCVHACQMLVWKSLNSMPGLNQTHLPRGPNSSSTELTFMLDAARSR